MRVKYFSENLGCDEPFTPKIPLPAERRHVLDKKLIPDENSKSCNLE
jgi:hypothetical protein